jgi:DNA-binding YbaB/EbfC family protein
VARGGPGGFDVNALMKQAQQMQEQMLQAQEKLKDQTVEASAGGGMVNVTRGGDLPLRSITIDPEAVDPEDVELLQEMVQAAVNDALRSAQDLAGSAMGDATGGLGGGGGLGGLLGG